VADGNRRERRAAAASPTTARASRGRASSSVSRAERYPNPVRRNALAPGLLAAIGLLAGLALLGTSGFVWIEYGVAILALIVAWFAYQAKQWWWIPALVAIAVLWNPVWPFSFSGKWWLIAQLVAGAYFAVVAITVKQVDKDADPRPQRSARR
jgi:hypothetical protein